MSYLVCEQVTRPDVVERVRSRYRSDMDALRRLGFRELCFYREIVFPFSLILFFPIYLLMRFRQEVVEIRRPLRISATYPLMVSEGDETCALVMGLGIKLHTNFNAGTGLISTNFQTQPIDDPKHKLYKRTASLTIDEAWQRHRDYVNAFLAAGEPVKEHIRFNDYVDLSLREEGSFH